MTRARLVAATLALTALAAPPAGHAQNLREQCDGPFGLTAQQFCRDLADAADIIQPRLGISATGGNPVAGTASTLGMRIGSTPRISVGLRAAASRVSGPPVTRTGNAGDLGFTSASLSLDASAGVFHGVRLLPTVGGFGSVDVLGSVGIRPLPGGRAYDGTGATWALGARVGILRESFTAPGISVSAMYRSLGSFSYGDRDLERYDAFLMLESYRVTSVRATVGKRVLGVGLSGGVGHDRYRADATVRFRESPSLPALEVRENGMANNRNSVFGNAAMTFMILNLSVELGWQEGGDTGPGVHRKVGKGGPFGGLAVRLVI